MAKRKKKTKNKNLKELAGVELKPKTKMNEVKGGSLNSNFSYTNYPYYWNKKESSL